MTEATEVAGGWRTRWVWWVAAALLGVALFVDVNEGNPLQLAASALLFVGCLLLAALPSPRSPKVGVAIVACFVGGIALSVFRAVSGAF
jgi:hypothetical protein